MKSLDAILFAIAMMLLPILMPCWILGIVIGLIVNSVKAGLHLVENADKRSIGEWVKERVP